MSHHCHATACKTAVPPEMLMCRKHWYMVPKAVRARVLATYRPGQCDDWRPSAEYCEAAKVAVVAVAQRDGIESDIKLYEVFSRSLLPEKPQ